MRIRRRSLFTSVSFAILVFFVCNCGTSNQRLGASKGNVVDIIGKFKSPNFENSQFSSEVISINNDGSFRYQIASEFTKIDASGRWRVKGRKLILNSYVKKSKMVVAEDTKPSDKIYFNVTYEDMDPLYFQLFMTSGQDTLEVKDVFGDTLVSKPDFKLQAFYIKDARGFVYPPHYLKARNSNYFKIELLKDRIFDNEVWQIMDNGQKLLPIGLSGRYVNYFLMKVNLERLALF